MSDGELLLVFLPIAYIICALTFLIIGGRVRLIKSPEDAVVGFFLWWFILIIAFFTKVKDGLFAVSQIGRKKGRK